MSDCNLHENQRKAGTLCRSMYCTKCPPYRGPTVEQQLTATQKKLEAAESLIADLDIALQMASSY